ncbi:putative Mce family protein [Mycolicibacterium parafortuitum]|uniref:Putative Mce family protein n=1 Tax=Mycolicibacterium parafortuitum TaxID=39692 RepID=A0A7I7UCR0_MYCPF|nr:MCE family protein [Mycolicibacterium parafortuitum]PQD99655.1 mammalian cell entry protein [Mycobacterium sp. EPG1]BBY78429.1 putative Mce family protein [Mycolicibacterium parafortuitum]
MQPFESATRAVSDGRLLLRGIAVLAVAVLAAGLAIAKSEGAFSRHVEVVALLSNVGDGLPKGSDVKFRGALVGTVAEVSPATGAEPHTIELTIEPAFAQRIPGTVTARVVPSNVFAVSSIQLVDNGPAPALRPGARIAQDESLATVQFQTALTKLRDILGAAGKPGSADSIGILATVAEATEGRGEELSAAGGGAKRIVDELNRYMAGGDTDPDDEPALRILSDALDGLQTSAPDLLDAVHHAVVPMRTLAETRSQLAEFLSAGLSTTSQMGTAFENNTERLIVITTQMSPVLGVIADGGKDFASIVTRLNTVTNRFFDHVWDEQKNIGTGKFMLVFTPNRMYTRADCPRYGDLEGPSCHTAPISADPPALPQSLHPRNFPLAPQMAGGNVGSVGSPQERAQLAEILGPGTNAASELLLGPVARGNTVQVVPDPGSGPLLPAETGQRP